MGSRIMELFSYWDQIKPDLQVANYSVTPKAAVLKGKILIWGYASTKRLRTPDLKHITC